LDQVRISGDAGCHLTGSNLVEETDVLLHAALKEMFPNFGADVFSGI
jgi:hypothetical protein